MLVLYVCTIIEVTSADYMHHTIKLKITTLSKISAFISMIINKYICDVTHDHFLPLSQAVTLS